jgi:hypothetical protein
MAIIVSVGFWQADETKQPPPITKNVFDIVNDWQYFLGNRFLINTPCALTPTSCSIDAVEVALPALTTKAGGCPLGARNFSKN